MDHPPKLCLASLRLLALYDNSITSSFISEIIITRTVTITREMMHSIRIANDDFTSTNSSNRLGCAIYMTSRGYFQDHRGETHHSRQSPHTRRFFVTWISDAPGLATKFQAIASRSLCPQSTDATVSSACNGQVIQLGSYAYPCSTSCFAMRSPSAWISDERGCD